MGELKKNDTIYSDKPVTGGETQIVINDIQVRAAIRTHEDIASWRSSQKSAESRYYPNRTRLYDLFDDVLLDGHLTGIIAKRIHAVQNKPVYYEDTSGKKVDAMDQLIQQSQFRKIICTIMETLLWGISGLEFIPGKDLQCRLIPRKHIKPKWQIISYEQNGQDGIDYTTLSNVWIIGEPEDLGLLLKCAPYAIYKRGDLADWANYIEIFGQPVRVIKYDATDKQTKIELRETLDESGNSLAIMIPKQADFDLKDGKQSNGDGQLQEKFKDSMNNEMSIIVLGNTETSTSSKVGSLAKAKTHNDQQTEIAKSDLIYTANMLCDPHFQAILKTYGYPIVEGGRFVFNKDIDVDFLEKRIEIDMQLAEVIDIPDSYWYETYGVPCPLPGDKVSKPQPRQKPKDNQENEDLKAQIALLQQQLADFFG